MLLSTKQVKLRTGWSMIKVRQLIEAGRLPAINISCGKRPFWQVTEEALQAFLNGATPPKPEPPKVSRNRRIDANVPKVF